MERASPQPLWREALEQLKSGIGLPLAVAASAALVLLMNLTPLVAGDFWTQAKVGELIRETGEIPDTVLFPYGEAADFPFLAYEWLPSLVVSCIHSLAGVPGVIVARAALALLIFGLLVCLSLQVNRDLVLSLFVAMASLLLVSGRLLARPELLSFVCGLAALNLLQSHAKGGGARWLLGLLPIAVLWANCHGSFPVGVALPLLFATGEVLDGRRAPKAWLPYVAASLGMAAASLLNPFGFGLIEKVLMLTGSGHIRADIAEWKGIFESRRFLGSRQFVLYALFVLLVAGSLLVRRRRLPARVYLTLATFLALTFDANRHVAWFGIAGGYGLAHSLDNMRWLSERREWAARALAAAFAAGCVLTFTLGNVNYLTPGLKARAALGPRAIHFIRESGYTGNVFNSYAYGGKLAYHFYPKIRITVDDRIDAYDEAYYRNLRRFDGLHPELLAGPNEFREYFLHNGLDLVVVRARAFQVWRATGRLAALEGAGWQVVFRDGRAGARILLRTASPPP